MIEMAELQTKPRILGRLIGAEKVDGKLWLPVAGDFHKIIAAKTERK
jgi:hypothetical protein